VFNTFGYRLLFDYVLNIADIKLEAKLDKGEYRDADLMEVKIPLSMPYTTSWQNFERVDGEINLQGNNYKYVKRKIINDTMILMCIRHDAKTQIQQKANDYFGKVNDLPSGSKKSEVVKQVLGDYDFNEQAKDVFTPPQNIAFNYFRDIAPSQQYISIQEQPPEI